MAEAKKLKKKCTTQSCYMRNTTILTAATDCLGCSKELTPATDLADLFGPGFGDGLGDLFKDWPK